MLTWLRRLMQPDCHCGLAHPSMRRWRYHTTTGCAATGLKLGEAQQRYWRRQEHGDTQHDD